MKTLIVTALVVILVMSWTPTPDYHEYEDLIHETESLTDSAAKYLSEIRKHNDSLLDIHFPKDEKYNQGQE